MLLETLLLPQVEIIERYHFNLLKEDYLVKSRSHLANQKFKIIK